MKTQKKCRGIGKALGYGCGKELPVMLYNKSNFKYGIGLSCGCFSLWLLNSDEGKKMISKAKIIAKEIKIKEDKQRISNIKESLKTLSDYKEDLQVKINLIVRLIDRGYPCIATDSFDGKMNAGHYMSVGSNPTIRFHLENIWLQSVHSNKWKAGDTLRYQQGIIKNFGSEYLDYLNSLQQIPPIRLTIEDIKQVLPICNDIIKELKRMDFIVPKMDRIELRKEANKLIGIYK